jgi:hypothetical protein
VFFNDNLAPSCLIPAFKVHGSQVMTIEGFETSDEYRDIKQGFAEAEVNCCMDSLFFTSTSITESIFWSISFMEDEVFSTIDAWLFIRPSSLFMFVEIIMAFFAIFATVTTWLIALDTRASIVLSIAAASCPEEAAKLFSPVSELCSLLVPLSISSPISCTRLA